MKEIATDKRQAALEATLSLIAEQGFHATPMSQIAKKANIGVGTIYRYFSCKEELINELYLYVKQRMTESMMRSFKQNQSVQESFREALKSIIRYVIEHPDDLSFGEQYANSPLITQATKEHGGQIMEPIKGLFRRAQAENALKDLPQEVLFALVSGAVLSLAKLYNFTGVPLNEERLCMETDAIWDMIRNGVPVSSNA